MLSSNEDTLTNLRLVGGIRKNEYLQTDANGDILSYLGCNFINCVTSVLFGENWTSTLKCLRKLYVDEIPFIIDELIDKEANEELTKILNLLRKSEKGLHYLSQVYSETDHKAHIDTITDDFLKCQIHKIKNYLQDSESDVSDLDQPQSDTSDVQSDYEETKL